jgi:hypothetical protein
VYITILLPAGTRPVKDPERNQMLCDEYEKAPKPSTPSLQTEIYYKVTPNVRLHLMCGSSTMVLEQLYSSERGA